MKMIKNPTKKDWKKIKKIAREIINAHGVGHEIKYFDDGGWEVNSSGGWHADNTPAIIFFGTSKSEIEYKIAEMYVMHGWGK